MRYALAYASGYDQPGPRAVYDLGEVKVEALKSFSLSITTANTRPNQKQTHHPCEPC